MMNVSILKYVQLQSVSHSIRAISVHLKGDGSSGGSAGAIREAGGAFGKMGAAKEAEYFYRKQNEQLRELTHKDVTSDDFQKNNMDEFKKKK